MDHVFEFGVVLFDGVKSVINQVGNAFKGFLAPDFVANVCPCNDFDFVPTGLLRHPEYVVLGVVVPLFQFGIENIGKFAFAVSGRIEIKIGSWIGVTLFDDFLLCRETVGNVF